MAHFPKTTGISEIRIKDINGNVIQELSGNPIAAVLETKDMDFGKRQFLKYVDVVVAEVTDMIRGDLVRAEISHRDSLSDESLLENLASLEDLDRAIFVRQTARYHKIRILSNSVGVFWRLGTLEIYGTTHGRRF